MSKGKISMGKAAVLDTLSVATSNLVQKNTDPRVKRTRQLIMQAFLELLYERDIQSLTVQDIAERATVNRATFYAHFVDKNDLMNQCVRDAFQEKLYARLSTNSPFDKANLRLLISITFEFLRGFHGGCSNAIKQKQAEPLIEAQVQQELHDFLLAWLQLSLSKNKHGKSSEVIATSASWAIFGVALAWSRDEQTLSSDEAIAELLELLTVGLFATLTIN